MRDIEKDLAICEGITDKSDYKDLVRFACEALVGWPEAIRRAMEAEARVKDLEEELSANKWQSKERGERIQELEAQCAVMREALEYADLCIRRERDETASIPQIAKALASSAGRDLLERLRKLEAIAEALLECEKARRKTADGLDLRVPPDRQLYMKAVELAREALEGGERDV